MQPLLNVCRLVVVSVVMLVVGCAPDMVSSWGCDLSLVGTVPLTSRRMLRRASVGKLGHLSDGVGTATCA